MRSLKALVCGGTMLSSVCGFTQQSASVALAWDLESDITVTGYNIYRGTNGVDYPDVFVAGNTNYLKVPLICGITNYFVCTASNIFVESDFSNSVDYMPPRFPKLMLNSLSNKTEISFTVYNSMINYGFDYELYHSTNMINWFSIGNVTKYKVISNTIQGVFTDTNPVGFFKLKYNGKY